MSHLAKLIAPAGFLAVPAIPAQTFDLSGYKASPGLTADRAQGILTVTWDGERTDEIRMHLSVQNGTPIIQDVALRHKGGTWTTLATSLEPEFHVVSGLRRMTDQQLLPLHGLGIKDYFTNPRSGPVGGVLGRAVECTGNGSCSPRCNAA